MFRRPGYRVLTPRFSFPRNFQAFDPGSPLRRAEVLGHVPGLGRNGRMNAVNLVLPDRVLWGLSQAMGFAFNLNSLLPYDRNSQRNFKLIRYSNYARMPCTLETQKYCMCQISTRPDQLRLWADEAGSPLMLPHSLLFFPHRGPCIT